MFEYNNPSALLTDLYQFTMAYGYWKSGKADQEAVFNLFFRRNPFGGNYVISSGLKFVVDYITNFSFGVYDGDVMIEHGIEYLRSLGLFEESFLKYLNTMDLSVSIDALPEGTIVFPQEPILRVRGPLLQCQLIETALLNIINFNSLIATKASRICYAAKSLPVLEFGLRRAQGIDGALSASRAAYIGGCAATSNVLAGKMFGIPVKGTHAHSWVMSFDSELEAFRAYAKTMPDNCIFLVDTYDVEQGVKNAITISKEILRPNGHELLGIRLDSGDLAVDSVVARVLLDEAGFTDTVIVASNDLDEHKISKILDPSFPCCIDAFGVGTNLITAKDDPALGGVYKLSALKAHGKIFENKIKISSGKTTLPGLLQVTRSEARGDIIHFETSKYDGNRLLQPVIKEGRPAKRPEDLFIIKERVKKESKSFERIMGIDNPPGYSVTIDKNVINEQNRLITGMKRRISENGK